MERKRKESSLNYIRGIRKIIKKSLLRSQTNIVVLFLNCRFLYYDEIKDAKDPNDNYEIMIDLADDGHHGQLTKESCEYLMTRGMFPRSNGTYSFSRDNRVKVRILCNLIV